MTDEQLAGFLNLTDDPRWPEMIARLDPKRRATFERMAEICTELELWEAGFGPKPQGVIICGCRGRFRRCKEHA